MSINKEQYMIITSPKIIETLSYGRSISCTKVYGTKIWQGKFLEMYLYPVQRKQTIHIWLTISGIFSLIGYKLTIHLIFTSVIKLNKHFICTSSEQSRDMGLRCCLKCLSFLSSTEAVVSLVDRLRSVVGRVKGCHDNQRFFVPLRERSRLCHS